MELVVDKVISELNTFCETTSANGGCSDLLSVQAVYFGDPGLIPVQQYPCFLVDPSRDVPKSETTGYEIRELTIVVTLVINAQEYFDAAADEAEGDRKLVEVMTNLRAWFRRKSNRTLDGLSGVRELVVGETDYLVQVRGTVIAKSAQTTLAVEKSYQRQA